LVNVNLTAIELARTLIMSKLSLNLFARELRKNSTDAEKALWRQLRNRHCADFKFRRQHVVGDFILDFYCPGVGLAIEVDGGGHTEKKQAVYDVCRTAALAGCGIHVLRFWNHEVLQHIDAVMDEIYRAVKERTAQPSSEHSVFFQSRRERVTPTLRAKL
jgi:very-short-patch-repair endonuclease